jgi:hypothetical protein
LERIAAVEKHLGINRKNRRLTDLNLGITTYINGT